jgi:D-alanyl-D-alanine carboxypeptidase/D-alanyl-D-alanine carboxypeptidase (penicillin-binding protein 5/6)
MTLICVTLNDKNDWTDHGALFDYGFENYRFFTIGGKSVYEIQTVSGEKETLTAAPDGELSLLVKANDEVTIKTELPKFLYAPVSEGQTVGKLTVTVNGEELAELPIAAAEAVALDKTVPLNFREKLLRGWRMANKYGYKNYTINFR